MTKALSSFPLDRRRDVAKARLANHRDDPGIGTWAAADMLGSTRALIAHLRQHGRKVKGGD